MNLDLNGATGLATAVGENSKLNNPQTTQVILAPPFPFLLSVSSIAEKHDMEVAAQNCASHHSGAFTGEVSVAMIKSTGASYVIIGHSERRVLFNESHELLKQKVELVLEHELQPIFCCGELIDDRNHLRHHKVVEHQLWHSLFHLDAEQIKKCVIAYEPVWAIGTGLTATPEQAQEMHQFIRGLIAEKYSAETSDDISILYGGSCNENNAAELFALPDVDGGLIGGASLKADSFLKIVKAMK